MENPELPQTHFSDLRPLTMGRIFDQAIRLYRRNFARFLGIAVIAQIPAALSSLVSLNMTTWPFGPMATDAMSESLVLGTSLLIMTLSLIALVWAQLVGCVLVQIMSDTYLGKVTTLGIAYRRAGRSWMAVIAALLLMMVVAFVMVFIFIIPIIGWLLAIPGLGLFSFFATVVVPMLTPVIVLEKKSARRGIARTWNLARTQIWWLFGFFLLLTLFVLLITQGPAFLMGALLSGVAIGNLETNTIWILGSVISLLLSVIFYPVQIACATLVYYNMRIRHEGLDLALQTVTIDQENGTESDDWTSIDRVIQHPPPDAQRFRPMGSEWGIFSLISLGTIGLGILFILISFALFLPMGF